MKIERRARVSLKHRPFFLPWYCTVTNQDLFKTEKDFPHCLYMTRLSTIIPYFPKGTITCERKSTLESRFVCISFHFKLRQNISFVVIVALSMAHGIKLLSLPWITVANEEWPVDSQKSWPRQNVFSGLMCMGSILLFPVQYWKKKTVEKTQSFNFSNLCGLLRIMKRGYVLIFLQST